MAYRRSVPRSPIKTAIGVLGVLVNLALGLFCLGLGLLGWIEGGEMRVDLLPVEAESAAGWLLVIGTFGTIASGLAISAAGWRAGPHFVWALAVALALVAAVFRSGYRFDGIEGLISHGWEVLASLLLVVASWWRLRSPGRVRRPMP